MSNTSNLSVATAGFAITPSDTLNFATRARGIYVGVGGNIAVVGANGVAFTLVGVPQGSFIPLEAVRVNATGTTAASLVGLV